MRWVVGLLLVSAAIFKAYQYVRDPALSLSDPTPEYLRPILMFAELSIGVLALTGMYWHRLRWLALCLFTAFTGYSLRLAILGASSCGCFGPLKVNPWWMFFLDMFVVLGLLLSLRSGRSRSNDTLSAIPEPMTFFPAGRQGFTLAVVTFSVLSIAMLVRYGDRRVAVANGFVTSGGLVILEPELWVGRDLPIAKFIDLDLSSGLWIVLFYRHDCPDCLATVPRYEQLASSSDHRLSKAQVALIEVPPFGTVDAVQLSLCRRGRLSNDREWFVQTPVEIQVQDGVVISASAELPALLTSAGR